VLAHHIGDDAGQQRVVGAPKDECVDVQRHDGFKIGAGDGEQLVARGDTGLDEPDEPRAAAGS